MGRKSIIKRPTRGRKGGEPFLAATSSLVAPAGFGALATTAGLVAAARLTPSKKKSVSKTSKKSVRKSSKKSVRKSSKKSVRKTSKKSVRKPSKKAQKKRSKSSKRRMINNKNK